MNSSNVRWLLVAAFIGKLAIISGVTLVGNSDSAMASARSVALVYKGPGACEATSRTEGCAEAAARIAKSQGFQVVFVGPEDIPQPEWQNASLWIQPGGRARIQAKSMSKQLKSWIANFVREGGGYVGFCAGGFLATEKFGWETKDGPFEDVGFGFFKGKSFYYDSFDEVLNENFLAQIIETSWSGRNRYIYWELGPYFTPQSASGAEIVSWYPVHPNDSGVEKIMTLRSTFGLGRVYVTAVHPEAPQNWRQYYGLEDPDGVDFSLAAEMVLWSQRMTR